MKPGLLLLIGEPGIGKTSLVNKLNQAYRSSKITIFRCSLIDPTLESIRHLAAQITGEPETSPDMRDTLAGLLPNPSGLMIGNQEISNAVALKALQKHLKHQPTLLILKIYTCPMVRR